MIIYVPVTEFRAGEILHGIRELDSDHCFLISGRIHHRGTAYADIAYTDPEGVRLYWNKKPWKAETYRYNVGEVRS